ncbi:outer membrane protein assembly factor BamD [Vitiosangium sp. GDMCC 1.1324]|uniref:outer membrane protein assembly factor BamD n=1 Tax=Vitiosangium sp. (strain GDMCC 1.1324) TaxID=2138576 RepID=UPI000D3D62B1|nr:outer membrane protein assembly factor BamD [Vitiosangium sp. GDMCC 1.1324]PTL77641.1 outer membrane protein assembly factor BamD [Vitiosangium sp. GDMCC 1.1324]
MRFLRAVCLTALLCNAAGCAALSTGQAGEPDYASAAETNLQLGDEALERKDFLQAERYYEHVRTKYPYLDVANEAELKLADLDFAQEHYPEAREKFQSFIKLHPTHAKVDYAAYRAALTHFADIPSDFFLLPPSKEKDQTEVVAALASLNDFVRQYPNSQYVPEAKEKLEETRRRLAEHEMYVANFYARRKRWKAVVQRLEGLLKNYPGTELEADALFNLHAAYLELNEPEQAKQTLQRVIERLPGTPAAERARRMMGS